MSKLLQISEPVPLCINCAHVRYSVGRDIYKCTRRKTFSPVCGEEVYPVDAEFERKNSWISRDKCGPEAKYFAKAKEFLPPTSGSVVSRPTR